MLGVVSSAVPIGGLPSFLLIGAGWWAVEKGARRLLRMISDDVSADPPQVPIHNNHKKKKATIKNNRKYKAKL